MFASLDKIHIELPPFILSESIQRVPLKTNGEQSSTDPQWTDRTVYVESYDDNEEPVRTVRSSPSSTPLRGKIRRQTGTHAADSMIRSHTTHAELQEKITMWLAKLPDRQRSHRPREEPHITGTKESTTMRHLHPQGPVFRDKSREVPNLDTEVEEWRAVQETSHGYNYTRSVDSPISGDTYREAGRVVGTMKH
ncbi:hypothetical protein FBEOM_5294 [Fusarium beomiforme]|uniref:Uncharacterized protein n=1 Tax=Fusarium beomiforme TaxID=44412 RepID=A0A9P5AL84_9HYPO|nr:hypothetical protein FBEOM_5294 [Fusarium beomiforme]